MSSGEGVGVGGGGGVGGGLEISGQMVQHHNHSTIFFCVNDFTIKTFANNSFTCFLDVQLISTLNGSSDIKAP